MFTACHFLNTIDLLILRPAFKWSLSPGQNCLHFPTPVSDIQSYPELPLGSSFLEGIQKSYFPLQIKFSLKAR